MNITLTCIPCMVDSLHRLMNDGLLPPHLKEPAMRRLLTFLAEADYDQSPPALGREMARVIRDALHTRDPYREIKAKYNRLVLELYPKFSRMVERSGDPVDLALRLAIAGNVIDFGAQVQPDVMGTVKRIMRTPLAIDDSEFLRRDLAHSTRLLVVGDNCGEIVFDRLLLQTLHHPGATYAVRGGAVLNDATFEDAETVGISSVARLITTGDDAPGVVWSTASQEFRDQLLSADVVIAKGQGNLEGLLEVRHNIYFLLMVKCDPIAHHLGVRRNDFVLKRSPNATP